MTYSSQGYALSQQCDHYRWQAALYDYYSANQHYAYQFSLHSIHCHANKVEPIHASVPAVLSNVPQLTQAQHDYQDLSQSMDLNAHVILEQFKQPLRITKVKGSKKKVSIPVCITCCQDTESTLSSTRVAMNSHEPLFVEINRLFRDQ